MNIVSLVFNNIEALCIDISNVFILCISRVFDKQLHICNGRLISMTTLLLHHDNISLYVYVVINDRFISLHNLIM